MTNELLDQESHACSHEELGKEHGHAEKRNSFTCYVTLVWPGLREKDPRLLELTKFEHSNHNAQLKIL